MWSSVTCPQVETPSARKHSRKFTMFVEKQTLSNDEVSVLLDVVFLFTIVPTDLAGNAAQKCPQEDDTLEDTTALEVEEIVMLLKLCLNNAFICFRGRYYHEADVWYSDGFTCISDCGEPGYGGD